jgi:hypothetical protein
MKRFWLLKLQSLSHRWYCFLSHPRRGHLQRLRYRMSVMDAAAVAKAIDRYDVVSAQTTTTRSHS